MDVGRPRVVCLFDEKVHVLHDRRLIREVAGVGELVVVAANEVRVISQIVHDFHHRFGRGVGAPNAVRQFFFADGNEFDGSAELARQVTEDIGVWIAGNRDADVSLSGFQGEDAVVLEVAGLVRIGER